MKIDIDQEERQYLLCLLLNDKQRHITEDLLSKLKFQDLDDVSRHYLREVEHCV